MKNPPLIPAVAASVLTAITVAERTPQFEEQLSVTAQAPVRRTEEQDETHSEFATAQPVIQGQEQSPPPVASQPLRAHSTNGHQFEEIARQEAEVAAWQQAQSRAQSQRNAFVVARAGAAAPKSPPDEPK